MIYHIFANRSNIGDWLSAKGIQKLLEPYKVNECLCDTPFVPETIKVLSKATEKDLIVIGGGGLLMDYFLPFWEAFLPISKKVPFCIWGIGYCDLKYEVTRPPINLIENIINKSKISFVRDAVSKSYLKNCKLPEPTGCPSLVTVENNNITGNKALLHVDNYTTVGKQAYDFMCDTAEKFAAKNEYKYLTTNNRIKKDSKVELENTLDKYKKSELILSSGLHGCIIGAAMGKKVLAVSGDNKIDAFMKSIGLNDWIIDSNNVHSLSEKLEILKYQKSVANEVNIFRNKNNNIAKRIKRLIKNNHIETN